MNVETFQVNFQIVAIIAMVLSIISLAFVEVALIGPFKGRFEKLIGEKLFVERFFLLLVVCLVLAVIAIIAFCVGVYIARITYGQIENIWNVISAGSTLAGACASIAAVLVAFQIPKKIAEQQNKIALVNSRLEIIDAIEKIESGISAVHNISIRENKSLSRDILLRFLSFATLDEFNKNWAVINRYSIYFSKFQKIVKHLSLLYANIMLECYQLEREKETNAIVKEELKLINEANEFIDSEEFYQLKNYMRNAVKLDK